MYNIADPGLPQGTRYYPGINYGSYGATAASDPFTANVQGNAELWGQNEPVAPYGMPPELASQTAGAYYGGAFRKPKQKKSIAGILGSIFVPVLLFTCTFFARCMSIRYFMPSLSYAICYVCLLAVVVFLFMAFTSMVKPNTGDPKLLSMLFITSGIAWGCAYVGGNYNYKLNMRPYYDQLSLNLYPNVDPEVYEGEQLMDAGQINFKVGSRLNLKLSYGFRNGDVFCIAPIVGPIGEEGNHTKQRRYDFWAVGLNCCSGHTQDFQCGEYNNPQAHRGLRLLRDDQRSYFRLAVKEAEAAYNIHAPFPVFMEWMTNPQNEVMAYRDDANKYFYLGVVVFLAWQVCVVCTSLFVFQKLEEYEGLGKLDSWSRPSVPHRSFYVA